MVEGLRLAEAAVAAGAELTALVVSEEVQGRQEVQALVDSVSAPVYTADQATLQTLSDVETSQGVLAVCRFETVPAGEWGAFGRILALDGVQDPGNVGTLIRTAAWFGVELVVLGSGTADAFAPKVVRATMGGIWATRIGTSTDLAGALRTLREAGYAIVGADMDGTPAASWEPSTPHVLVLGSEAHGLSAGVRDVLTDRVALAGPAGLAGVPSRPVESLNVSVAGGVLLWKSTQ